MILRSQHNSYASDRWVAWVDSPTSWPSCIMFFAEWLFRFFSKTLSWFLFLWFWPIKCDGSHYEPAWIPVSGDLAYFLSLSWILISAMTSLANLLEDKRSWGLPSNSQLSLPFSGRALINYRCLRLSSRNQEDHPVEFSPKCQPAELWAKKTIIVSHYYLLGWFIMQNHLTDTQA